MNHPYTVDEVLLALRSPQTERVLRYKLKDDDEMVEAAMHLYSAVTHFVSTVRVRHPKGYQHAYGTLHGLVHLFPLPEDAELLLAKARAFLDSKPDLDGEPVETPPSMHTLEAFIHAVVDLAQEAAVEDEDDKDPNPTTQTEKP